MKGGISLHCSWPQKVHSAQIKRHCFINVRDCPFLCTYFKNPNNVRISDDPPTHPQIRTTMKGKIRTPGVIHLNSKRLFRYIL